MSELDRVFFRALAIASEREQPSCSWILSTSVSNGVFSFLAITRCGSVGIAQPNTLCGNSGRRPFRNFSGDQCVEVCVRVTGLKGFERVGVLLTRLS